MSGKRGKPSPRSDAELRKRVAAFLDLIPDARVTDRHEFNPLAQEALSGGDGFWLGESGAFRLSQETIRARNEVVSRATEVLGPKRADRRGIADALWHAVEHGHGEEWDPAGALDAFLSELETMTSGTIFVLLPNRSVEPEKPNEPLKIGHVEIMSGSLASKRSPRSPRKTVASGAEEEPRFAFSDAIARPLPNFCWIVKVDAAHAHAQEEGEWSVRVALSLMRLCALPYLSPLAPRRGQVEAFGPPPTKEPGGVIFWSGDDCGFSAYRFPWRYVIGDAAREKLSSEPFSQLAEAVFEREPGTLAERLNRGLGWLARGRQTADRAERLLFFFTALESLFARNQSGGPVTETLTRSAATIATDDPDKRQRFAEKLKKLYNVRSALVHRGARTVSDDDANSAQAIAEYIFKRVLTSTDPTEEHEKFLGELKRCSYGAPWIAGRPDRLGLFDEAPA